MYPIIIYMYMCGIDVWPQIYWTNKLKYTVIIIIFFKKCMILYMYVNTHKIVEYGTWYTIFQFFYFCIISRLQYIIHVCVLPRVHIIQYALHEASHVPSRGM